MRQNQVQILIPASMSKLWTTSCCVLCDHKGGGCLCAGAGAGINKAPTFGVLNRIKMCVAALLSSCQAGNQSAARCGKIFHSDLKIFDCYSPPQLSGRLHGHKKPASDWSERSHHCHLAIVHWPAPCPWNIAENIIHSASAMVSVVCMDVSTL